MAPGPILGIAFFLFPEWEKDYALIGYIVCKVTNLDVNIKYNKDFVKQKARLLSRAGLFLSSFRS
jgi:hypothetical protein